MQRLSNKQTEVLESILHFFFNDKNKGGFVFSGVAGSGKTTIVSGVVKILEELKYNVATLAYTGKAVSALHSKGISLPKTIHSFLYQPTYESEDTHWDGVFDGGVTTPPLPKFIGFIKKPISAFEGIDFIIIDESSFIPRTIFSDLSELDIPILFVGDREQLPPIDDTGFNVMDVPDIHLDEIHRQAEFNPIIMLSKIIRETGNIPRKYFDETYIKSINRLHVNKPFMVDNKFDIILCGTNNERMKMNKLVRSSRDYHSEFAEVGESIINLRNCVSYNTGSIYNGEIFTVLSMFDVANVAIKQKRYDLRRDASIEVNERVQVIIPDLSWHEERLSMNDIANNPQLADFTFGYAITVHKSQGSEFDNVLYIDDDVSYFTDQRKFRYTAVTRAKNKITIAK